VAAALLVCSIALAQSTPSPSQAKGAGDQTPARFDGKWLTTVTCPGKGKTEGYKIQVPSVITDSNFHGERGTVGEPGYLLIEGKISDSGKTKLSTTGKVSSRKYGTGIFTTEGTDYSYTIKAQFEDTKGEGTRDAGLGIVGRACTYEFMKH
jgi:hypothetical protein